MLMKEVNRELAILVYTDRRATITSITMLYNCGDQKSISECTTECDWATTAGGHIGILFCLTRTEV